MNEKELKKISRKELLELLIEQTERIEILEKELAKANAQLRDKKIYIEKSGSIAEAALKVTDIFNKAQEACDIYTASVKAENEKMKKEIRKKYEVLERKRLIETDRICNNKIKLANKKLSEAEKKLKESKRQK